MKVGYIEFIMYHYSLTHWYIFYCISLLKCIANLTGTANSLLHQVGGTANSLQTTPKIVDMFIHVYFASYANFHSSYYYVTIIHILEHLISI